MGCLTEREIAHLLEDDVTEDAQLQGATLPLEKPYLETSAFSLWKKRSVWLLLLFVAEAYTSSVIQHFEEALESGMEITLIVSLTLVCITLWSAIVSSVIPMVLKRCKIDPAVVSAPFIATLIDGTGLIIYFKIAQYTLGLE